MKKFKHLSIALFILLTSSLIAVPALASADFKSDACNGLTAVDSGGCSATSTNTLSNLLSTVIQVLSIVVGVVAVIMIIVGGLRFITSGGDSSNTASARNTVIYALVGLVVAVLAQVLVHFVLKKATG